MALMERLNPITRPAASDQSANQYKLVELNSSGQVSACNAAGELSIGVLQNKPSAAGQAAEVAIVGSVSKVVLGATVAAGAKVTTDASGRAVTAVSTNTVIGICLKGGAVNEIGEILVGFPSILA